MNESVPNSLPKIPAVTTTASDYYENSLDSRIAPGLRLWMLLAMILGILLLMMIVVCCFMKIRIPRTKREIELMAAKRKLRKQHRTILPPQMARGSESVEGWRADNVIVMQSLGAPDNNASGLLLAPPTPDAECTSCAESCATSENEAPPTADAAKLARRNTPV